MRIKFNNSLKFFVLAIAIGLFSVIFAKAVDYAFTLFLHLSSKLHYWLFIYIPCGFIAITYMVTRYYPEAAGSGIPQALAIEYIDSNRNLKTMFYPRIILSKFVAIVMGTMFGATIGREGPTIQIGATILSLSSSTPNLAQHKILLKIGAAAGLAAAFNTPLGGIVFALEELFKDSRLNLSLAKIAVIGTAGLVSVIIVGNNSYFGRVSRDILFYIPYKIVPIAILMGIFSGVLATVFSRIVYYMTISQTSKYNLWKNKNPLLNAGVCGILVAGLGLISHGLSFGNGYHESIRALAGIEHLPNLYAVYKMLGSIISTCSGVPGGYFATSLSIGEGIGSLLHNMINLAPIEQYYLLGMVAFLAAMTQAPVTAITMVLQITYSQVFLLPLMVAALVSTYIASLLDKGIYHHQIKKLIVGFTQYKT